MFVLFLMIGFPVLLNAQSDTQLVGNLQELKTKGESIAVRVKSAWGGIPEAAPHLAEAERRYENIRAKQDNMIAVLQEGVLSGRARRAAKEAASVAEELESMTVEYDEFFSKKSEELKMENYGLITLVTSVCAIINCPKLYIILKDYLRERQQEQREAKAERLENYKMRAWSAL